MRRITTHPVAFAFSLAVALLLCGAWATAHTPPQQVVVETRPAPVEPGVFVARGTDADGDGVLGGDEDEQIPLAYVRVERTHHVDFTLQIAPGSCPVQVHARNTVTGAGFLVTIPEERQGRVRFDLVTNPGLRTIYFAECPDSCDLGTPCDFVISNVQIAFP